MEGSSQLPETDPFTEMGPADTLDLSHLGHVVAPARGVLLRPPRYWSEPTGQGGGPPLRHRSGSEWVPFTLAFGRTREACDRQLSAKVAEPLPAHLAPG